MSSALNTPWPLAQTVEGNVWLANFAEETTPISFTAYDQDRPDVTISVPSGTIVVPICVRVVLEDSAGTDTELRIAVVDAAVGEGTSTAITDGPHNLRSDLAAASATSACTVRRTHTANVAVTGYREIFRSTYAFADASTDPFKEITYAPFGDGPPPPVLVGPATLFLGVAATTTQAAGFANLCWAEFSATSEILI